MRVSHTSFDRFSSDFQCHHVYTLVFILRLLRPMQLGRHFVESSPRPSPTQTTRKRPSAADAHTISRSQPFRQQSNTDPFPVYPAKVPRSASVKTPREAMRAFGSSSKKHFSSAQGSRQSSHSGKNKKARQSGVSSFHSSVLALPRENDPVHDAEYINRVHGKVPLKEVWEQNPKSPLSNYLAQHGANSLKYLHDEILIHGNSGWRQVYCTPSPRSLH
jgi:hypothetical protein